MTAADAAKPGGYSFEDSVFADGLFGISGTTGVKSTSARQKWRHRDAVNGKQQK